MNQPAAEVGAHSINTIDVLAGYAKAVVGTGECLNVPKYIARQTHITLYAERVIRHSWLNRYLYTTGRRNFGYQTAT